jgi:hypothetical protein
MTDLAKSDKEMQISIDMNAVSVQECFPYLSADERELMISGMCGSCFDNLMKKMI